ncbi:hypothetical protein F8M41_014779 [Gigaspora margarita]|uniref:Uncharacterized protein n=1 Tax=Gigaspora margarita TaxID=4874 RepID=A0A8H3ZX83_GIGMA|nr:hypothetical protein F8M41_014779 [Gigaspora margarita]
MSKDITTYFTRFAAYSQKAYHESFVTRNCIPWWNIDFARSYVIQPDYEIFLWIKSFDCTRTTQYKNESQLLREFKQLALKQKKKQKSVQNTKKQHKNNNDTKIELQKIITTRQQILDESYTLKSPEYHPQSPFIQ